MSKRNIVDLTDETPEIITISEDYPKTQVAKRTKTSLESDVSLMMVQNWDLFGWEVLNKMLYEISYLKGFSLKNFLASHGLPESGNTTQIVMDNWASVGSEIMQAANRRQVEQRKAIRKCRLDDMINAIQFAKAGVCYERGYSYNAEEVQIPRKVISVSRDSLYVQQDAYCRTKGQTKAATVKTRIIKCRYASPEYLYVYKKNESDMYSREHPEGVIMSGKMSADVFPKNTVPSLLTLALVEVIYAHPEIDDELLDFVSCESLVKILKMFKPIKIESYILFLLLFQLSHSAL